MSRRVHLLLLQIYRRLPRAGRRFVVRRTTPLFNVGSMCIIERDDGALLLVRHSYRQAWGVPGGLLSRHEQPADAAHREALEEVVLDIELVGRPAVVVDADARRVDVIYRARPAADVSLDGIRPRSPEIVEARWFPADQLPELQGETAGALVELARVLRP